MNHPAQYPELIIDEHGRIENIYDPGNHLLGAASEKTESRHISMIIPTLSRFQLFRKDQINPRLRFLARIGQRFEVHNFVGGCVFCKLFLHVIEHSGKRLIRITMRPVGTASLPR